MFEIITDNQHNLGKLGRVKVHSHGNQWRRIVMFVYALFAVNAPVIRIVYTMESTYYGFDQGLSKVRTTIKPEIITCM